MSLHRIELCTEGLGADEREVLLDLIWNELRISPGMVSADGNFELLLSRCAEPPEDAPIVKIDGALFTRVSSEKLRELIARRR